MKQKTKERIGGLFFVVISVFSLVWIWSKAISEHYFYPKFAGITAAFLIIGLGLLIFGGYRSERMEKGEDISTLNGLSILTPRWWIILVLSLISAFANIISLYGTVFQ